VQWTDDGLWLFRRLKVEMARLDEETALGVVERARAREAGRAARKRARRLAKRRARAARKVVDAVG